MRKFEWKIGHKVLAWVLVAAVTVGSVPFTGWIKAEAATETTTKTYDFEDGTNNGFFGRGSSLVDVTTDYAHNGEYSLKVTGRTQQWEGPSVNLTDLAPAGTKLTISSWVRNNEESAIEVNLTLQEKVNGTDEYNNMTSVTIPAGEWKKVEGTITVKEGCTEASPYWETPWGKDEYNTASYCIDDITVTAEVPVDFDTNYSDGITFDFAEGENKLDYMGSFTMEAKNNIGYKGGYGLAVSGRTQSWQGPAKDVSKLLAEGDSMVAGKSVAATALVQNTADAAQKILLSLKKTYSDETQDTYETLASAEIQPGEWEQLKLTDAITFGENISDATVYICTESTNGDFVVDSLNIVVTGETGSNDIDLSEGSATIDFENGMPVFDGRGDGKGTITTDASEVHGGTKALKVTGRTADWNGVEKLLSLEQVKGKTLSVSAWVKAGVASTYSVTLEDNINGEPTYTGIANAQINAGEWAQISGQIEVSENSTAPKLYFQAGDATTDFVIDDITIEIVTIENEDWGVFTNKTVDFEDGKAVFTGRGDGVGTVTNEDKHNGTYSLKVTGRTDSWNGVEKDLTTSNLKGKGLKVSFWVKSNTAAEYSLNLEDKINGDATYSAIASASVKANTWTQITGEINVQKNSTAPKIYFQSSHKTAEFYIDDVNVQVVDWIQGESDGTETEVKPFNKWYITFDDGVRVFEDRGVGQKIGSITTDAKEGSKALAATGRTDGWQGLQKDLTNAKLQGKGLKVSGWFKNTTNRVVELSVGLEETKTNGKVTYSDIAKAEVAPGEWVYLSNGINVQKDTKKPVIYFNSSDKTASFIIDSIVLETTAWGKAETESSFSPFSVIYVDFENGKKFFDNRGDVKAVVNNDAKGGTKALSITGRTQQWEGVQKDFTGAGLAGKAIQIGCWVKNTSNRVANIEVGLEETKTNGNVSYNKIVGNEVAAGEWVYLKGGINVQKDTKSPVLFFNSPDATVSFSIDDVVIETVGWGQTVSAPSVYPFTNMWIDFEDGKKFFSNRGSATASITSTAHTGSKALKVTGRSQTWEGVEKDFSGAELQGKGLKSSFWVKNISSRSAEFAMGISQEFSDGTITYAAMGKATVAPGQWVYVEGAANVEKNTVKPTIFFDCTDASASFIIDDIGIGVTSWIAGLSSGSGSSGSTVDPFESMTIDFEDGDVFFDRRGDSLLTITDKAHGGSKALSVTGRTDTWMGIEKNLVGANIAGLCLSVSFWAKNDTSEPMNITSTLQQDFEGKDTTYQTIAGDEVQPGEWLLIEGEINVDASTTKPVICFEAGTATGEFSIDDITIKVGEPVDRTVQPFDKMTIDFEDGDKWFDKRGVVRSVITDDAHESTKALSISKRTEAWMGVERDITGADAGGKVLKATFWVKHNEATPQEISLNLQEKTSTGEYTYNRVAGMAEIPAGEWVQVTGEFYPDIASVESVLYFDAVEPTTSFIVDDIELSIEEMNFVKKKKDKNSDEDEVDAATQAQRDGLSPWLWLLTIPVVAIIGGVVFLILKKKKLI